MAIGTFLGGLMGEVKQHPWTTISAMVALAGVSVMFPAYLTAGEIASRVEKIELAQQEQIRETLENRLGNLKSSHFDLVARIDDIRARGEVPDKIYYDELKRLSNEIDKVSRQLEGKD